MYNVHNKTSKIEYIEYRHKMLFWLFRRGFRHSLSIKTDSGSVDSYA